MKPPVPTSEEKEINADRWSAASTLPSDGEAESKDCTAAYHRLVAAEGAQPTTIERKRFIRRRILVTLCAVLSMLLVAEALARAVISLGRPAAYGCATFDIKKQLSQTLPCYTPSVLFLGSSLTMNGVYVDLIEREVKRTGDDVSFYNLACHNSYPLDQLFLLQNAIDHGARPSLVVMEINPLGFIMKPEFADQFSPMLKNAYAYSNVLPLKEELLGEPGPKPDLFRALVGWLNDSSYLIRYRAYLKSQICAIPAMVLNTESMTRHTPTGTPTGKVGEELSEHGYAPLFGFMNEDLKVETVMLRFPLRENGGGHLDYGALRVVSSFCAKHKIKLALLWLPFTDDATRWTCKRMGATVNQLQTAVAQAADENRALLIDVHDQTEKLGFADVAHLNLTGSLKVSQRLVGKFSSPPLRDLIGGAH